MSAAPLALEAWEAVKKIPLPVGGGKDSRAGRQATPDSSDGGGFDAASQLAAEAESGASAEDGQGAGDLAEFILNIVNGSTTWSAGVFDVKNLWHASNSRYSRLTLSSLGQCSKDACNVDAIKASAIFLGYRW